MATVSELTSKNIANAQANVQTWGNILVNVKVYGAKGDGVTDDTAAINSAVDYAYANGIKIIYFPSGTYRLTSRLQFNFETSGMLFIGYGAIFDTTEVGTGGIKRGKITFDNCEDVIFEGFEIFGNNGDAIDEDDWVPMLEFWSDTKRCVCRYNTVRGVDSLTKVKNGISFYSANGECYGNYLKWGTGFGFILINDTTEKGNMQIHHNIVEEFQRHFEPVYSANNMTISHNVSINPQGAFSNHFTVWAKNKTGEVGQVGFMDNIEICNNKCYGGRDGVWLTLGNDIDNMGDYIKNVNIHHNEFIGVGRGFFSSDNFGNYYEAIKFNDNYVEVDEDLEGSLFQFSIENGYVKDFTIENNYLQCLVETKTPVNIYITSSIEEIYFNNNTLKGIGKSTSTTLILIVGGYVEFTGNKLLDKGAYTYNDLYVPTTARAYIVNNKGFEAINAVGTNFTIKDNPDFITKNRGTATITSAETSVLVQPSLAKKAAQKNVLITPISSLGSANKFYAGPIQSDGSFYISVDIAPGADLSFSWVVELYQ